LEDSYFKQVRIIEVKNDCGVVKINKGKQYIKLFVIVNTY